MKDELRQEMLKKAVEGKLSCATARKIAEDLKIPYQEIGKAANELGIRIKSCQLGCF
jgi:LAO/AO transport system kinase